MNIFKTLQVKQNAKEQERRGGGGVFDPLFPEIWYIILITSELDTGQVSTLKQYLFNNFLNNSMKKYL